MSDESDTDTAGCNTARVHVHVVSLWERLYEDEPSKDVELLAKDGTTKAHSLILGALSEPLKKMLSEPWNNGQTKVVSMSEYTVRQLKFILELTYTGHVAHDFNEPTQLLRDKKDCFLAGACGQDWCLIDTIKGESMLGELEVAREVGLYLELLCGYVAFAKKFEVNGFFDTMLNKLQQLLCDCTFNVITDLAITSNVSPLLVSCLRFAESSPGVRFMFDNSCLGSRIVAELRHLWPDKREGGRKRKTFL